jgi:hypothetical protein
VPSLTVPAIPAKYDRIYKAPDRTTDAVYDVNVARLECACPDFVANRAAFPPNDARRVCAHLYDKLYATKVERSFGPLVQLFIRYGRSMFDYRFIADDVGEFVIGQPFGPDFIRAIGVVQGKPIVATYDLRGQCWSTRDPYPPEELAAAVLARIRALPTDYPF